MKNKHLFDIIYHVKTKIEIKIKKEGEKMSRLKTFLIYLLILVGFFILSNFLIEVSLNASYKTIGRKDNLEQVIVYQAEATKVNVRLKATINNLESNPINKKYVRIDFYSNRDNIVGTKYIDVSNLQPNEQKEIKIYARLNDVSYYEVSYTDEKTEEDLELLPTDMTRGEIIVATVFTLLILW